MGIGLWVEELGLGLGAFWLGFRSVGFSVNL